jgi:uncharacterized protein YdhG (YjbR/CyaY superfamily)
MATSKPQTVNAYLATLSKENRAALQRLRKTIRTIVPRAEECISYQIPAFRLDGKVVAWYGAARSHCAFYPGAVLDEFKDELAGYETSKGTIRFDPEDTLPASLVRKLVKARIARVAKPASKPAAKVAAKKARRSA